ncbi:MAG: cytosine permease, partial [Actinobacteria bacterium]|nr:cytosine permease [Actinomycetota bacterium]
MSSAVDANVTITPGAAPTEPGRTLAEPPPRTLGWLDQVALWGNLGVSLLGPAYAAYVLEPSGVPAMSLVAAFVAVVVGTLIGTLLLSLSAVPGAQTGHPAMVLLRGLFGAKLSYLPTVLNLVQCLGWGVFELVVIANAAQALLPWHVHWPYVVVAGALTTLMALRPLGMIRSLRRYALVAVVAASVYFLVELGTKPLPALTHGSWSGFWLAADSVLAVSVSWVPLAADYTRHSRSARGAFTGSFL